MIPDWAVIHPGAWLRVTRYIHPALWKGDFCSTYELSRIELTTCLPNEDRTWNPAHVKVLHARELTTCLPNEDLLVISVFSRKTHTLVIMMSPIHGLVSCEAYTVHANMRIMT